MYSPVGVPAKVTLYTPSGSVSSGPSSGAIWSGMPAFSLSAAARTSAYVAAKHGVAGLTKAAALELGNGIHMHLQSGLNPVESLRRARPDLECVYEPDRAALAGRVAALAQPGDLVLTLGAGDITTLADELAPLLATPGGRGAVDSPGPATGRSATLPPRGARLPVEGGDP